MKASKIIKYLPAIFTLAAGALFLVAMHQRILSYVCGNDPKLYIRAARVILNPSWYGLPELVHSLTFVAPGYPLILAGAIALFGDLAPYWVNLVLLTATLPLLWYILRRLMGTDRAAAFALLGLLIMVFLGHEYNPPAMLYPFREPARLLFVFGAYALLLMGLRNGMKRPLVLLSGLSLLAACLVREPSILVLPGLLLGLLGLTNSWRTRVRAGFWFLLPWMVVGILVSVVVSRYAYQGSQQMAVLKYLTDTHGALIRGQQLIGMFPEEAGWWGLGLIAIGVMRSIRRSPVLLAWFLLPAVLFFVFHCFMQVHVRYFLTSILFLSVFAGYGLDGLIRLVGSFRKGERWEKLAAVLCVVVMAAIMVQTIRRSHPWEPVVTAVDVRDWQTWVRGLPKGPDGRTRVVVEQRSVYIEDMMSSYTDVQLLDARDLGSWPTNWEPAVYYMPLNRQAEYQKPEWLLNKKIYAHRIMADRMDLLPSGGREPIIRTMGRGKYAQVTVRSWQAGHHDQILKVQENSEQVIWIDWGNFRPEDKRVVTIRNATTGKIWFSQPMTGNGLQGICMSSSVVDGPEAILSYESSWPGPTNPVIKITKIGEPVGFSFGVDRMVSINRLFPGLSDENLELWPVLLGVETPVEFEAPRLYSTDKALWEVSFCGEGQDPKPIPVCCNVVDKKAVMGDLALQPEEMIRVQSGERVELRKASTNSIPSRLTNMQLSVRRYE